jgi:hypothetical protein
MMQLRHRDEAKTVAVTISPDAAVEERAAHVADAWRRRDDGASKQLAQRGKEMKVRQREKGPQ